MTVIDYKPLQQKHGGQIVNGGLGWEHRRNRFNAVGYCAALGLTVNEYIDTLKPQAMSAPTRPAEAPKQEAQKERKGKGERVSGLMIKALSGFPLGRCAGRAYLFNGVQAFEIGSLQYRDFVARFAYVNKGIALSETTVREIAGVHRGEALFTGDEKPVGVRVIALGKACYLDLCDASGTVIEVTGDGWKPCLNPPVYFFRPPHLKPLPMPQHGGKIEALKDVLTLSDADSFVLIRSALLFYLYGRPGERGTFPILRLCGPSGSAKSSRSKQIKYIIDPATPEGRTLAKEPRDLYISAKNQYCLVFDNVSHMDADMQDSICSLASRGGYGRKKNYSDSDEEIFEDCRPIIINGITFKVQPDLQGRMLNIDLSPIQGSERKTESDIWNETEKQRPGILGGLLDALSATLREVEKKKDVSGHELPRLADFSRFTIHAERANGWPEGETIRALNDNYAVALTSIAEDNPLTEILKNYISGLRGGFSGTAEELLHGLNEYAKENCLERHKSWPDSASKLGNFITRNSEVLQNQGIQHLKERTGKARILRLWSTNINQESEITDNIPFEA